MKILFDHQIFTFQRYGGISRYYAEIISHLPNDFEAEVAIKYSNNEYLRQLHLNKQIENLYEPIDKFLPKIHFRGKTRLFRQAQKIDKIKILDPMTLNKNLSTEMLKKQDFDVFHPTYFDDYFLDYLGTKPFILDIHDMIHEIFPELQNDPETSRRKALLARRANHIIAVSEKTKADIINILNINPDKISVIYRGNSFNQVSSKPSIDLPNNYLLFVGERIGYKNFLFLLLALEPILKENKSLKLICSGHPFSENEKSYIHNLDLDSVVLAMSVTDKDLYWLYAKAKMFIFPSYYEGFGIPILEAFQAGCPVILANASCFPEIAKDAALYFDPKSLSEIRLAVEKILDDKVLRNDLVEKGFSRSKLFSWDDSANQTIKIYESVCSKKQ